MQSSQNHSNDQYRTGRMSHIGSNGSTMKARITATGFNWNSIGENVAAGYASASEVMAAWMKSPGHRENILNENYQFYGGTRAGEYWTQDFGESDAEQCQIAVSVPPDDQPPNNENPIIQYEDVVANRRKQKIVTVVVQMRNDKTRTLQVNPTKTIHPRLIKTVYITENVQQETTIPLSTMCETDFGK